MTHRMRQGRYGSNVTGNVRWIPPSRQAHIVCITRRWRHTCLITDRNNLIIVVVLVQYSILSKVRGDVVISSMQHATTHSISRYSDCCIQFLDALMNYYDMGNWYFLNIILGLNSQRMVHKLKLYHAAEQRWYSVYIHRKTSPDCQARSSLIRWAMFCKLACTMD